MNSASLHPLWQKDKAQPLPKLHRNLVRAIGMALDEIFNQARYADRVVEYYLKSNPTWGARDRSFIAEEIYDCVRYRRLLEYMADISNPKNEEIFVLLCIKWQLDGYEIPEWFEDYGINEKLLLRRLAEALKDRKIKESIPYWMDEICQAELGEQWPFMLHALNKPAELILRANTLKTTPKQLAARLLEEENCPTEHLGDEGLLVNTKRNLFKSRAFADGDFEVQDFASQQVAPFLEVAPKMRVVDACAGAGGKTLHLAALMQNKGSLLALDTVNWKLEELRNRSSRAAVQIIETRWIDSTKVIKRIHGSADRLLLDVPCSGLGVLRRNPDAKWKLTAQFLEEVKQTQAAILNNYSPLLKVGGKMVYSTCSVLPAENQQQIQRFLAEHPDEFELEEERTLAPHTFGFDGFYMARLRRLKV